MEEPKFIDFKGKKIVYLDFSDLDTVKDKDEMMTNVKKAKALISSLPQGTGLTLTNATNLRFNSEIVEILKEFAEHNKPYVKVGAMVGIVGLQKMMYDFVMKVTKRNLPIFSTVEEAKDWLVAQ